MKYSRLHVPAIAIFVIVYLFFFRISGGKKVMTVTFQPDGVPSSESWILFNGTIPDLEEFTVCAYIKILRGRTSFDSLVSYGVRENFNELYIGFQFPTPHFSVWWGMEELAAGKVNISLLIWQKFCYVQDLRKDRMKLWWNDEYHEADTYDADMIKGGGLFFLGQDQDDYGGGFNDEQSMSVIVSDFRVYDRLVSDDEVEDYINCKDTIRFSPLMDFTDVEKDWILNGPVESGVMSTDVICSDRDTFHLMFPERRLFTETIKLCNITKGEVIVPMNQEENNLLLPVLMEYSDICMEASGWTAWIGVKANASTGIYYNINTGMEVEYQDLVSPNYLAYHDCVPLLSSVGFEGMWGRARCEFDPICSICDYKKISYIKVRGLCAKSLFDLVYLLYGYKNRKANLRGFYNSDVRWNNHTWIIEYLKEKSVRGEMMDFIPGQYPFGKRSWKIYNDKCTPEEFEIVPLVFTTCRTLGPGRVCKDLHGYKVQQSNKATILANYNPLQRREKEYTCDDGTCIPIDLRCNLFPECPDQSDEIGCDIIQVPHSYIKVLPPPPLQGNNFNVSVGMTVTSISSFSLIDLTISYDLTITLKWLDARLSFTHLKEGANRNQVSVINQGEIWIPGFFLENESGSKVSTVDFGTKTFVDRMALPIEGDVTRLKEDQLYLGKENGISQEIVLATTFQCQFDLGLYPFDRQKCKLIMKSTQGKHSVQFSADKAEFLGERRLLEYQVDEVYSNADNENDNSRVTFVITFFNLFKYYIFGTYIPTTLIVIITYLTFFFPLDDFQDRVMVSLTALMVLAALFLQTSQGVARTSYIKVIDVWFICCMIFNFANIVCLVFINFYRTERSSIHFTRVSPLNGKSENEFNYEKIIKINYNMRIIFPVLWILFILTYFSYILVNASSSVQ